MRWAQRADCVYLTIAVTDCKEPKVTITATSLKFEYVHNRLSRTHSSVEGPRLIRGKAGPEQQKYACEVPFFAEIVPEVSID